MTEKVTETVPEKKHINGAAPVEPPKKEKSSKPRRRQTKLRSQPQRPRKPDSLKRSRALKRKYMFEPLAEGHLKYCWAAYRRGCFDYLVAPGLEATEFTNRFLNMAAGVVSRGGEIVVCIGPTPNGEIPIAVVAINYDGFDLPYPAAFPHAEWFPEASDRNKIEAGLQFFLKLKETKRGVILVRHTRGKKTPEVRYYEHLAKYGIVRPVGHMRDYYEPGVSAMIFETTGHDNG